MVIYYKKNLLTINRNLNRKFYITLTKVRLDEMKYLIDGNESFLEVENFSIRKVWWAGKGRRKKERFLFCWREHFYLDSIRTMISIII